MTQRSAGLPQMLLAITVALVTPAAAPRRRSKSNSSGWAPSRCRALLSAGLVGNARPCRCRTGRAARHAAALPASRRQWVGGISTEPMM